MENFLRSKEYWQVVSDGIPVPEASMVMTDARKTKIESVIDSLDFIRSVSNSERNV